MSGSTILLKRQGEDEILRTIDISLWFYLFPRTAFCKQRDYIEFLTFIYYHCTYKFYGRCENLKFASCKCGCLEAESNVDASFDDEDRNVFDKSDSLNDELL